jgi:lipopolysaccharide transport system ATP-binding protein
MWQAETVKGKCSKILAVEVQNGIGQRVDQVRVGETIRFLVWYQADHYEPVHVGISLKNKYGQVVNHTSSYSLGVKMPLGPGGEITAFGIEVEMNLEAGQYSVMVNLSYIEENPNQGVLLDETTWFGPVEITWNYLSEAAPFLGMFGLPATALRKRW